MIWYVDVSIFNIKIETAYIVHYRADDNMNFGDIHWDVLDNVLFPILHAKDHLTLINLTLVSKQLNALVNRYLRPLRDKYSRQPSHQDIRDVTKNRLMLIVNMWLDKYDVTPFMMKNICRYGLDHNISVEFVEKLPHHVIQMGIRGACMSDNKQKAIESVKILHEIDTNVSEYYRYAKIACRRGNIDLAKNMELEKIRSGQIVRYFYSIAGNPYYNKDIQFIENIMKNANPKSGWDECFRDGTMLIAACGNGANDIAKDLLNIYDFEDIRNDVFMSACASGNFPIILDLMYNFDCDSKKCAEAGLYAACEFSQNEVIGLMLNNGAQNFDEVLENIYRNDNLEGFELITSKWKIDARDELVYACAHKSIKIVKKMLNDYDRCFSSEAFELACMKNYKPIIDMLLPCAKKELCYGVIGACYRGDIELCKKIISQGCINFHCLDCEYRTHIYDGGCSDDCDEDNSFCSNFYRAFRNACFANNVDILQLLFDKYQCRCLDIIRKCLCEASSHTYDVVAFLLKLGGSNPAIILNAYLDNCPKKNYKFDIE